MGADSEFQSALVVYLEGCYSGKFLTSSLDEIVAKTPYRPDNDEYKGLHTIIQLNKNVDTDPNYKDPIQTMPICPLETCNVSHTNNYSNIELCQKVMNQQIGGLNSKIQQIIYYIDLICIHVDKPILRKKERKN